MARIVGNRIIVLVLIRNNLKKKNPLSLL